MSVLRHSLSIDASDLMELLKKQSARYQGKLDYAVSSQDYSQAKELLNKLEDLSSLLSAKPLEGTPAHLVIDLQVEEPQSFGVPQVGQI